MKLALVEVASPDKQSVAERRARVVAMVADAAGADLITLPELWAPVRIAGHSRVIGPWGEVLTEAGTDEGITWADVDPGETGRVRARVPVVDRRRSALRIVVTEGGS